MERRMMFLLKRFISGLLILIFCSACSTYSTDEKMPAEHFTELEQLAMKHLEIENVESFLANRNSLKEENGLKTQLCSELIFAESPSNEKDYFYLVEYPVINTIEDNVLDDAILSEINATLRVYAHSFVEAHEDNYIGAVLADITYFDSNRLSVVFSYFDSTELRPLNTLSAITFDLETGKPVDLLKLVHDEDIQKKAKDYQIHEYTTINNDAIEEFVAENYIAENYLSQIEHFDDFFIGESGQLCFILYSVQQILVVY